MENCTKLNRCLACDSDSLIPVLDLGSQPLANSYKLNKDDIQEEYPLAINHCSECFHVQLTHAVDPHLMFDDYLYVSGTSKTGNKYFEEFANNVLKDFNGRSDLSVLDIGCNDGTQLDYFKKLGFDTYGVDPAENLYEISSAKGHKVICDYFKEENVRNQGTFDVIVAQNVFAHNSNPFEFLKLMKSLLNRNGMIYIQISQVNMILNNEFDTIYHEHISFFNILSMVKLCERVGLNVVAIEKKPIHGHSYLFKIEKATQPIFYRNIVLQIMNEFDEGLHNKETYENYAKNCKQIISDLKETVEGYARRDGMGFYVVGYGAAAKGMTLLNAAKLHLDFIIDDNPLKQGRFTPGMSIPIHSIDKLDDYENGDILFIPLAWNFYEEIRERIDERRGVNCVWDKYVVYFPKVRVES